MRLAWPYRRRILRLSRCGHRRRRNNRRRHQHHLYRRWRLQQPARSTTRSTSSYTWAASLPKTPTSRETSTAAPKSLGDVFRKFSTELFDRPNAPLRLKARLLKAEAMEALLYGCMTWAPRNAHYRQLLTTHHKLLLRVIGYHRVHGTYRKMSYAKALKKTGSQSVEATICQRRLLFAGALARQGDKRLPKRLLFAERLEGGGRPGTRPAGTTLAEKLEGRLQGIRSSTRLHAN